jgi:L-threonylcarbamoyladenylate synthase
MKIISIQNGQKEIVKIIKAGGVIVFPSDTIYGLICDATNKKAIANLFKIKARNYQKPVSIFLSSISQAKKFVQINKKQEKFLKRVLPGKLTIILKAKYKFPKGVIGQNNGIGVRIPNYKPILSLLKKTNVPLSATSANVSDLSGSGNLQKIINQFKKRKNQPNLIVDIGILKKSKPSTVIDLTGGELVILREGAVSKKELLKML